MSNTPVSAFTNLLQLIALHNRTVNHKNQLTIQLNINTDYHQVMVQIRNNNLESSKAASDPGHIALRAGPIPHIEEMAEELSTALVNYHNLILGA